MKVVWLSDLHFVTEGSISGYDPRARLAAAVAHINAHCADCAFCIVSGDLVDVATPEAYAGVKAALDDLALPYFVMMGNHDAHPSLRAAFDLPTDAMADFAQYVVTTNAGLFVCLDSKTNGTDGGYLCHARLAWLDRVLREAQDRPVYVFLHHPPVGLDMPPFDEIGLANASELMDIVTEHSCVRHIFAGHVHQAISGHVRGIPFTIARSVVYQSPPPEPAWNWESFKPAPVAPAYGVIHVNRGDVVVHSVPFCELDFGRTAL